MKQPSNRLHKHVADFISEVKKRCPEALVEVSHEPFETEDAHLIVHPPGNWTLGQCETLGEAMAELGCHLLLECGVSIPVLVIEPRERVSEDEKAFQVHRQQTKKAS